jgi:hypothetical protein
MSGRKVAKRACDGCKVRKIKCSEVAPCEGCVQAGIACTFIKNPRLRGPRKLRRSTLDEIELTQRQWEDSTQRQWEATGLVVPTTAPQIPLSEITDESVFAPSKVASLVLQLCIYRLRMYPVWPIIKVERLVAALQKPQPDIEVFAMAYAVAAATIAQIKPASDSNPGAVTAEFMEAQCQYAKARRDASQPPNVTTVRIAFFLHVYYENQEPGGLKSILYLREAISIAHLMGLHRESYYTMVEPEEQQIRRRTLWLLFVTERGVSILHKLPVILKTKAEFPSTQDTDEASVLSAFQKLIGLFWSFDQSGIFDALDSADFDMSMITRSQSLDNNNISSLYQRLGAITLDTKGMGDVQAVDIALTRQWMRVLLWRLSQGQQIFTSNDAALASNPIQIASEFLAAIQSVPETAIEAHGPGLELKVFEVASSVVDAVALGLASPPQQPESSITPEDILTRLQRLLKRNVHLDARLRLKIAGIQQSLHLLTDLNTGIQGANIGANAMDFDFEQQLQTYNFNFNEPLRPDASPGEESLLSDNSPLPNASPGIQHHISPPSNPQLRGTSQQISRQQSALDTSSWWSANQQRQQLIPSADLNSFQYDMSMHNPAQSLFGIPDLGWTPNESGNIAVEHIQSLAKPSNEPDFSHSH